VVRPAFFIRADIPDGRAPTFEFVAQKTMYGGKSIATGDTIYLFANEARGGCVLVAQGRVTGVSQTPRKRGVERQTPRVSIAVRRTALPKRSLGRDDLKAFTDWEDGRAETELNFKFFRQATDKIGGISAAAAGFLDAFF
jgi:hypothetical protein